MQASSKRYMIGVLGSTLALVAMVFALTPGAQASSGTKSCPNKTVKFEIESSEGSTPYKTVVKDISVKGTTCAKAYEFFHQLYNQEDIGKTGSPQNYHCKTAEFKAPAGYVPTMCTKPGKTIKYAGQGG